MAEIIDKLLTVQDLDLKVRRMERELKDIPARKEEINTQLSDNQAKVEAAKESLQKEQLALKTIEDDITDKNAKIGKLREQQLSLKTNKEFKAMNHQIEVIENDIDKAEGEQLAVYDQIESAQGALAEAEKVLADQQAQINVEISALDERANHVSSEIENIKQKRADAAATVDAEWLNTYERILKSKGNIALVPLENNVCGGCYMTVPYQLKQDTKRQDEIVSCNYCGRMLY